MALVQLKDVSVAYHKQDILKNFNLDIEKGKLISLLGPSGCGKTTTLRLIAGFLEARAGQFLFKEKDYTKVPVNRRNFGFVFQNYALFPHLSVFDNVAFGLRLRKLSKKEIEKRVASMLEIVDLSGFEKRFTQELSGGQRQRVAIARALIIEPDLLLFDEPLSNLDANLRVSMRVEIRRIQQELGITTVYVSHDQEECFSISDQVAVMNQGNIEQLDEPSIIYKQPKTTFVADFIGFKNFITFEDRENLDNTVRLQVKGVDFFVNRCDDQSASTKIAAIRPDNIRVEVVSGSVKNERNVLKGTVTVCTFLGRGYQFIVDTAIGPFTVNQETEAPFEVGQHLKLIFPEDKLVLVE